MVKAQKFIYAEKFHDEPTLNNFKLVEEELPELQNGDVLAEAVYLTVDPYMRVYMIRYPLKSAMIGGQIARVIKSKDEKYPVGSYIWGYFGWRNRTIFNTTTDPKTEPSLQPYIVSESEHFPLSLYLGILGMPGNTAYFGFLEICQPKAGETVVVTGAAGAVGSAVGQIAKLRGCKVIGIAGSDEKCSWLKSELGFDHAINYKTAKIKEALIAAAPNGIDCYFDNVGGEISSTILSLMNTFGRVSVCGSISSYNSLDDGTEQPKASIVQLSINHKQLKIEGFIVYRWLDRWNEGITEMRKWIEEGKLKYHETVTNGFENMPQAFLDMLNGKNIGKAVVKV